MLTTAAREINHTPVLNKLIPSTDSAFGRTAITSCSVTTFCFYIIQSQNSPARYQLTEHMNWQRHTRSSVHACVWDSILRNSWSCRCITYLLVCLLTQTFPIEEGVASSKMAYSRLRSGDTIAGTRGGRRAGYGREKEKRSLTSPFSLPHPCSSHARFSIAPTERELGTGQSKERLRESGLEVTFRAAFL